MGRLDSWADTMDLTSQRGQVRWTKAVGDGDDDDADGLTDFLSPPSVPPTLPNSKDHDDALE